MNKFSEAFAAAQTALTSGAFAGKFEELKPGLRQLLGADGLVATESKQLEKLRTLINTEKGKLPENAATPAKAAAKVIMSAAGAAHKKQERAATLKMLKHLYHVQSSGGQALWVYSPPVAYTKWVFDETKGASDVTLETVLGKPEDEVYTEAQRGVMAAAVQEARAVCMAVAVKLGAASDTTKEVVRRYFGTAATTEQELITIMTTLASGYLKIAAACNGSSIVVSDEPGDRTGGGWKDWAFIYTTEAMSVIYLQGAWLAKAGEVTPSNQSPLYRCVRTVIHELSHKQVSTEDIVYGPKGLKPEGSAALTAEYALHNADSWAYFAVDVLGYLTGPDKTNGETPCKAILKVPTRNLTAA